ncbi:RNA polymerase sigma factor SigB [Bacillus fonticola]|uniref:RNA polymerase sigma factor SigB n=1 Tax=Bacillus fonticola TaxID=2728853 RepID=UPI001473D1C1|nr:RNA polymerase sigma factor SigB [Bacillus fonticola]
MPEQSRPKDAAEEVLQWIEAYQQNEDETAQYNLVLHYRPLVESIARKYTRGSHQSEDIAQVGMVGLLGAIRRYDASFEKSFEAFAIPTIVGEMKRFLRDRTWSVHVPRRIKELGPKIKATVEELTIEFQRSPKIPEIADRLKISEEALLEAMEMGQSYQALSVDHTIEADADGGTVTLLDLVGSPDEGYEQVEQRLVLERVYNVLTDREREIIEYTYLQNRSQKETGELLEISQMHVSRLQRRAIKKLREAIHDGRVK